MSDLSAGKRGRPAKGTNKPAEAQRADSERTSTRKERIPMTKSRKLDFTPKSGYVARWVLDKPGRLEQCQDGGYEFVKDAEGNNITRPSGASKLYLMQVPEQYYREDKAEGQKRVTDVTESKVMQLGKDEYLPDGHDAPLMRDKDLPI